MTLPMISMNEQSVPGRRYSPAAYESSVRATRVWTPVLSFDELFVRSERRIFNLIHRLVGNYEDAIDLTSQTFLSALRNYHQFRGESQIDTWLQRIAINQCKNYYRDSAQARRFGTISLDTALVFEGESLLPVAADHSRSPEQLLEHRELQAIIRSALAQLPPLFRNAILLRDVLGLSYQEVADTTGCSLQATKCRIFRARACLRTLLRSHLRAEV